MLSVPERNRAAVKRALRGRALDSVVDPVCLHEAAHALAAFCAGMPITHVALTDTGGECGATYKNGVPRVKLVDFAVAGGVAEALSKAGDFAVGDVSWPDLLSVYARLDMLGTEWRADEPIFEIPTVRRAVERVADLLVKHWAAVHTLAGALQDWGRLEGHEAESILRRHGVRPGARPAVRVVIL